MYIDVGPETEAPVPLTQEVCLSLNIACTAALLPFMLECGWLVQGTTAALSLQVQQSSQV